MNTIKIPVKVTTVEESSIEIETPCYTRVETHVYRISGKDNRKDCIQVFCAPSYEEGTSIACSYFDLAFWCLLTLNNFAFLRFFTILEAFDFEPPNTSANLFFEIGV